MTDIQHAPASRSPWPPPAADLSDPAPVGGDRHRGDHDDAGPDATEQREGRLGLVLLAGLVVALGVATSWWVVVVVLAIAVMIFMHELGHYLTAKSAGMKVTEFFLGFGPRIWSFRRGETEYGIKAVPLGAYVKIIGMHNLDPVDPADEDRTYRSKPYWRRMSVATAGSAMHFLMALVLAFVLLVGWGVRGDTWSVAETPAAVPGGAPPPAVALGLQAGDRIVSVDGRPAEDFDAMAVYLRARPGEQVTVVWERDGEQFEGTTTLASRELADGTTVGFLGVQPRTDLVRSNPVEAVPQSFRLVGDVTVQSVQGLVSIFSPSGIRNYADHLASANRPADQDTTLEQQGEDRVISIVGAVRLSSQAAETGLQYLLGFLIAMNVFVGIFNLVPLLPLDGGHVLIATYERLRSRKDRPYHADVRKMMPVAYATIAVLGVMFVTSLYLDIANPLANPFQ